MQHDFTRASLVPAPDPPPALSPPDATGDSGGDELIVDLAELEHAARFYRRSWPIPALATVREWVLIVRALDTIPVDDDQAPEIAAITADALEAVAAVYRARLADSEPIPYILTDQGACLLSDPAALGGAS